MRSPGLISTVGTLFFLFSFSTLTAGDYTGHERFSVDQLSFSRVADFDFIEMGDSDTISLVGAPVLPCVSINVALPLSAEAVVVKYLDSEFVEIDGTYDIMPCARPRRISNPAQGNPFVKDPAVYGRDAFFPGRFAEQVGRWDLAGQEFVTLRLFPVQYNPVTGKVFLAKAMSYEVLYDRDPFAVRKTYNFSDKVRARTLQKMRSMAVNPEAVELPVWSGGSSRALAPGNYEHVIITTTGFENEWSDLVDHYTLTGVPSNVVTTSWIYSNYSGSDNPAKIRSFVIDAHSTWGTIYFLIGGDTSQVPYDTVSIGGDSIPNDTYLSDFDDDWHCEVYVGRASVDSASQISTFLTKTLDYAKVPPTGFGEEVFLMGFDVDSVTPMEKLMNYIINNWLPAWMDLSKEYDSEPGGHESDVKGYINAGQNLTNHADHCNWNVIGVGNGSLSISECKAFHNGDRKGIFCTLGCWPGAFEKSDCWGEEWVKDSDGGGIGFVGNTRYGWYSPGHTGCYSGRYNQKYCKALWHEDYMYYHVGEALGESKNDYFPTDNYYKYIFMELCLTGDPAVPLWCNVPGNMTCAYDATIGAGSQSYNVNVKDGGQNLEGALVCLWKGSQVYECALTDIAGNADLTINPTDDGTMFVTVTAQDYKIHFGQCTVSGSAPSMTVDIVLDSSYYKRGDPINWDVTVYNNSGTQQTTFMWTNVTRPGGATYPPSGYLNGPVYMVVDGYGSAVENYSATIPGSAPYGTYTFNAFIGPDPGIDDEDHATMTIGS